MQFSNVLLAAAAFALTNAIPQFTMTASFFTTGLTAGSTYNITWSGASGPVTLFLKNGDPTNLQTVSTIASGLTTTSYPFFASSSLPNGEYAFEIDDSTGPNYSEQIALTGGAASVSASGSTTLGSTTSGSTHTTTAPTSSPTSNLTITSVTKSGSSTTKASTTSSSTSKSSTTSTTSTPNTNSASSFASPLAFVFLAIAAMLTLN